MNDHSSLIATSISAVFIIGLMATYVQIMNHLIDKEHAIKKSEKNLINH